MNHTTTNKEKICYKYIVDRKSEVLRNSYLFTYLLTSCITAGYVRRVHNEVVILNEVNSYRIGRSRVSLGEKYELFMCFGCVRLGTHSVVG